LNELLEKIRRGGCEILLRKDLVIPAGTVLTVAPKKTVRSGPGHFDTTIGLSKDSSGSLTYFIDPSGGEDTEQLINEWFIVI
jgi:hypothetical protein